MCGFLSLCTEGLTPVQMIVRVRLLKLGVLTQDELRIEATGEPRLGCFGSLETQRKGDFGNRGLVLGELPLLIAPLIALEFRRCRLGVGGGRSERERCGCTSVHT